MSGEIAASASTPVGLRHAARSRLREVGRALGRMEHSLLGLLAVTAFTLGYIGFRKVPGLSTPDCIYDTLQLFAFKYDAAITSPSWELDSARFLALGVSLSAAALALSAAFRDEFQAFRARFRRNHVVVCGLGPGGVLATISFGQSSTPVVAIEANKENRRIPRCREAGALVLKGDARDTHVLLKARADRASHLVVMCGDDERNAEVVASARTLIEESRRRHRVSRKGALRAHLQSSRRRPLRCIVEIVDFDLAALLTEASLASLGTEAIRLEFFNIAERGAQAMLQAHPPFGDTGRIDDRDPHILVVGLGHLGGSLVALAALRWAYLRPNDKLAVTVLDHHARQNIGNLCARYNGLEDVCAFTPLERHVTDPDFWRGADFTGLSALTTAYVCLGQDAMALTAGLALRRSQPLVPTIVRTMQHPRLSQLLGHSTNGRRSAGLYPFDVLDHVCQSSTLLQGPYERIARAIHARHLANQEGQRRTSDSDLSMSWENAHDGFRESSRRSAEHIAVKLEAVGLTVAGLMDWNRSPVHLTTEDVEVMAMLEHERWCDERRSEGWMQGPVKDVTRKVHPSLVPWVELPESDKAYDRDLVRSIPEMLASVAFTVVPIEDGPADRLV